MTHPCVRASDGRIVAPDDSEFSSGDTRSVADREGDIPAVVRFGIGGALSLGYLPTYVAIGKGYLDEEVAKLGAKVEVSEYSGSPLATQALQSGQLEYIDSTVSTMLGADAQGAHIGVFYQ